MPPSPDRYGRSLQDLINMVAELREREVGFTSLHENLDTSADPTAGTSGGRALVGADDDPLADELREGCEDVEDEPAAGSGGRRPPPARSSREAGRPSKINLTGIS